MSKIDPIAALCAALTHAREYIVNRQPGIMSPDKSRQEYTKVMSEMDGAIAAVNANAAAHFPAYSDEACRKDYENRYHKMAADLGYDSYKRIWDAAVAFATFVPGDSHWRALVDRAIETLNKHAPPGGLSDRDALTELYGIFDGPEWRAANFIFTSGDKNAIPLGLGDRRFVAHDDELEPLTPGLLVKMRASVMPEEKPTGQVYGIIDPDYGRIYTMVRKLAWEEGYAIGLHGSFTRDLDLIAVPWEAGRNCKPEKLVARILQATGMTVARAGNPGDKPYGRLVWTLLLPEFGDPRFVDLSIMPATKMPGDAELFAVARTLADRSADACHVDREDNWKQYGQEYRDDAVAVLQAIADGKPQP